MCGGCRLGLLEFLELLSEEDEGCDDDGDEEDCEDGPVEEPCECNHDECDRQCQEERDEGCPRADEPFQEWQEADEDCDGLEDHLEAGVDEDESDEPEDPAEESVCGVC